MTTRKPKILVVEDSDTMWYLYNDLLAEEYELQRATEERQALLELVRMKPNPAPLVRGQHLGHLDPITLREVVVHQQDRRF